MNVIGHLMQAALLSPFVIGAVMALMPAVHDADTAFDSNRFLFEN